MQVAKGRKNPAELLDRPVYIVANRLAARGICPCPEHHFALIATDCGCAGAVWRTCEPAGEVEFAGRGNRGEAWLCRIITPGMGVTELRRMLLQQFSGCQEVLADPHGRFHQEVVPEWFNELARCLQGYFSDRLQTAADPKFVDAWSFWESRLEMGQLTEFQRKVLTATARIPRGTVLTYAQVARKVGNSRAARAVGAALGSNPWPVIVPCHRVVGATGAMVGFSAPGGVEMKKKMLARERE